MGLDLSVVICRLGLGLRPVRFLFFLRRLLDGLFPLFEFIILFLGLANFRRRVMALPFESLLLADEAKLL